MLPSLALPTVWGLMAFAQISTRIGGAMMIVIGTLLMKLIS